MLLADINVHLCMANSYSSRIAKFLWRHAIQGGMDPMLVIIGLERVQSSFKTRGIPEQDMIEELMVEGTDQSFDIGM